MVKVVNTVGYDITINEQVLRNGESGIFPEKHAEALISLGCSYEIEREEKEEQAQPVEAEQEITNGEEKS